LSVIDKKILRDFWELHADSEQQLKAWYQEADNANRQSVNELKADFPNLSMLSDNRVCFNIKGNKYPFDCDD